MKAPGDVPDVAPVLPSRSWSLGRAGHAYRQHQREKYTRTFAELQRSFEHDEAIPVDFRALVGVLPADELSHGIFPYPARLLRHIPRFLLGCRQLIPTSSELVSDPFCGSGTVLLEALSWGHRAVGLDVNPLAVLVSRVKTEPLDPSALQRLQDNVLTEYSIVRDVGDGDLPTVMDKWYHPSTRMQLAALSHVIRRAEADTPEWRLLALALAQTADRASVRDPRVPVPVRRGKLEPLKVPVEELFLTLLEAMSRRVARLPRSYGGQCEVTLGDAREPQRSSHAGNPGLVLTSPPYGAAQKYVRSSSLGLNVLGLAPAGTAQLTRLQIGREYLNSQEVLPALAQAGGAMTSAVLAQLALRAPKQAAIYAHYLMDMRRALCNAASLLPSGSHFVLIAGDNVVAGQPLGTHLLLDEVMRELGLSVVLRLRDRIKGRQLLTKRRNGAAMTEEYVYVYTRH